MIVTVIVGFTTSRPVVPDEHFAKVVVAADSEEEGTLIAAQIVACHCEMPTSTEIVDLIL